MATRLSSNQLRAFRALLRAHAHLTRLLEADLERDHDLSLPAYEVMLRLAEAPGRRLRMSELADSVFLSRSGMTRLVDRLEKEGLLERQACPSDARGLYAVLTPAGLARFKRAAVTHLRGVDRHVFTNLSDEDAAALAGLLERAVPAGAPVKPGL